MSKAQHTPGPWAIDEEMDCYTGGYHIRTDDGYAICGLWDQYTSLTEDAQKANALLIASAPELLEALEAAHNQMSMAYECVEKGFYDEALVHLGSMSRLRKEAIAKAKGDVNK